MHFGNCRLLTVVRAPQVVVVCQDPKSFPCATSSGHFMPFLLHKYAMPSSRGISYNKTRVNMLGSSSLVVWVYNSTSSRTAG